MWCMPLVQEFEASVLCIVSGQPGRYSETLEREGGGWRGEKEEGERGYYCGSLDQTLFPGLETLVHTDSLCPKVSNTCLVFPHCLLIYFLKQIARHYSAFLFCLSPISWSHVLTRLVPLMGFSSCPNHYSDPASFSLCFSYLSHLAQ